MNNDTLPPRGSFDYLLEGIPPPPPRPRDEPSRRQHIHITIEVPRPAPPKRQTNWVLVFWLFWGALMLILFGAI